MPEFPSASYLAGGAVITSIFERLSEGIECSNWIKSWPDSCCIRPLIITLTLFLPARDISLFITMTPGVFLSASSASPPMAVMLFSTLKIVRSAFSSIICFLPEMVTPVSVLSATITKFTTGFFSLGTSLVWSANPGDLAFSTVLRKPDVVSL